MKGIPMILDAILAVAVILAVGVFVNIVGETITK